MNRPLVALGLVAVALSLLTILVADMQQAVEDPQFELSQKGAEAAADAAEKLAPQADSVIRHSNADSITLPDGATLTLPEGTEIDGDLIRLAQALAWTFPAGTELENLSLELPAGLGFEIPEGTWADGDTLVFPAGSTLRLDDGTVLQLPHGGRLTMPGASSGDMARMLDKRHGVTREGSLFSAPSVTSEGDWPVVFPAGTEFTLPEGMELPEGTLASDTDVQFPPGSTLETSSATAETGKGGSLFDKIGDMEFGKSSAAKNADTASTTKGLGFPSIGGTWWLWTLVAVALLVATWFVWRHRARLRRAFARGAATGLAADAPARTTYTINDRPGQLPLALEPGTTNTLHLVVEAKRPARISGSADGSMDVDGGTAGPPLVEWAPTGAEVRLALDGQAWTKRTLTAKGTRLDIPALGPGTHRLTATLTAPAFGTVTVDTELHVARWNEQVARDYQRLYERALATLELPDGVTPRLLGSALRARTEPEDDARLDEVIRTFEIANYGHAEIDETEWIRFAERVNRFIAMLDQIDAQRPGAPRPHDGPSTGSAPT